VGYVALLVTLLTDLFTHLSLLMTLFADLFPYAIRMKYVALLMTLPTYHSDSLYLSLYSSLFTYNSLFLSLSLCNMCEVRRYMHTYSI